MVARLRLEEETPQYRSRSSRLQKWKELATQASLELELPGSHPQTIMHPGCTPGLMSTGIHLMNLVELLDSCHSIDSCVDTLIFRPSPNLSVVFSFLLLFCLSRPGHVVVFHLPSCGKDGEHHLEVGLVLSVWKGVKKPKQISGECSVTACMAFRAVALDMDNEAGDGRVIL